ncbi:hypothetical protein ACWDTP_03795 [Mycobacterium sp. NPDC003449]
MTDETPEQPPSWDSTQPHFSTVEKHGRITVPPVYKSSGALNFFVVLTFLLWAPVVAWATIWYRDMSRGDASMWQGLAVLLFLFLPGILTGITAEEARDAFGQRATGNRVATASALAGVAVGLLAGALWIGGGVGGLIALASVACSAGAAVATIAAWRGIGYTRERRRRLIALRAHGTRAPGVLREVTFLEKWTSDDPRFTVVVEFDSGSGRRRLEANMTTTSTRVPRPGTAVVVFSPPDAAANDTDVHIELDETKPVRFDPHRARYAKPSGN